MKHQRLRCAVLDDYPLMASKVADWSAIADRVEMHAFSERFGDRASLIRALADFDIAIAMRERTRFDAETFAGLPRLALLVTTGKKNAAIDLAAAAANGVTVCGTGSGKQPPTELTWALILGLARHLYAENHAFRTAERWQSTLGADLHGKQLGLVGLGHIGSRVARVGAAFGMNVAAWSPNLTRERAGTESVRLAGSLIELMETSDFVSLHIRLGPTTRGLIGERELAAMRNSAYLINTSRSQIVDREALLAALETGAIAGAGLDVFDVEPVPADDPLRSLPNVLCTPHLGYVTRSNYELYFGDAIEDIRAFISGAPIRELTRTPTPATQETSR